MNDRDRGRIARTARLARAANVQAYRLMAGEVDHRPGRGLLDGPATGLAGSLEQEAEAYGRRLAADEREFLQGVEVAAADRVGFMLGLEALRAIVNAERDVAGRLLRLAADELEKGKGRT